VPDPTGVVLNWSDRVPQGIGAFVMAVAVLMALQRHEFTSPNFGLVLIVVIATPWFCDMIGRPRRIFRSENRLGYPLLVAFSLLVLGGVCWLTIGYPVHNDYAPFIVVILIGEMASTAGPVFGAVVWALAIGALVAISNLNGVGGNLIWAFGFTIGWLGGVAYRTQLRTTTELAEAQTQLAAQAAEEERRRLAREVHDLIAHSLAVTMLQMGGARLALAAGDTDEALAALTDAEAAGRAAMAEIHRTVGLLGHDGEIADAATPSAADVPELVEGFRRAGLEVDFALKGDLARVPMGPGLAAFRVVQESLSNAVKHAPGAPVDLGVAVGVHEVTIHVVNPVVNGTTEILSGGAGIRGMSERAELLGGTVTAGNGNGSWAVDASIPWTDAFA
jgi:signal transduction histidine kinase